MHILDQVRLFEGLSEDELNAVQALAFPLKVEKDDFVFREESLGHQLYVVLDGQIKIVVDNQLYGESDLTVSILSDFDIFGEFCIFDDLPRSASALAGKTTSLLEFHKADLLEFFEKEARIGQKIMVNLGKILCERLRSMDKVLKGSW